MPKMEYTVPIQGSTFIMDKPCKHCGSTKFKSHGYSEVSCDNCGQYFEDLGELYKATWHYDPIPQEATNI